jgi:hypothetical protein
LLGFRKDAAGQFFFFFFFLKKNDVITSHLGRFIFRDWRQSRWVEFYTKKRIFSKVSDGFLYIRPCVNKFSIFYLSLVCVYERRRGASGRSLRTCAKVTGRLSRRTSSSAIVVTYHCTWMINEEVVDWLIPYSTSHFVLASGHQSWLAKEK